MKRIEAFNQLYEKVKNDKKVIVFGAGQIGRRMYLYLKYKGNIVFITDNNENAYIGLEDAISVNEIEMYIRNDKSIVITICVAKENVASCIYNQIKDLGIPEDIIFWYNGEGFTGEYKTNLMERGLFNGAEIVPCLRGAKAEEVLAQKILAGDAFLCSRWGSVEGMALFCKAIDADVAGLSALQNNAGVYPLDNPEVINEYLSISARAAGMIDYFYVAVWCNVIEELYEIYSPQSIPVHFRLRPDGDIWLNALTNKKVLVVHPFAKLIETQYKIKDKLFKNIVIPDFELITVPAVQSMGGSNDFATWIDAFEYMKDTISKKDFDVALLGCGAYGMPLGAFIKEEIGKPAIHVGGELQLFFGIKGKRWDERKYVRDKFYNEYWVRPTDDLKPENWKQVEGGCYW